MKGYAGGLSSVIAAFGCCWAGVTVLLLINQSSCFTLKQVNGEIETE